VVLVLAVPLTGCCVYLGQLSPGGEALEYTHATANSAMVGMTLHRVKAIDLNPCAPQWCLLRSKKARAGKKMAKKNMSDVLFVVRACVGSGRCTICACGFCPPPPWGVQVDQRELQQRMGRASSAAAKNALLAEPPPPPPPSFACVDAQVKIP
jgi:hypothetical protein